MVPHSVGTNKMKSITMEFGSALFPERLSTTSAPLADALKLANISDKLDVKTKAVY